jgi:hypothetical protein
MGLFVYVLLQLQCIDDPFDLKMVFCYYSNRGIRSKVWQCMFANNFSIVPGAEVRWIVGRWEKFFKFPDKHRP